MGESNRTMGTPRLDASSVACVVSALFVVWVWVKAAGRVMG
jgi:hypothetical protein